MNSMNVSAIWKIFHCSKKFEIRKMSLPWTKRQNQRIFIESFIVFNNIQYFPCMIYIYLLLLNNNNVNTTSAINNMQIISSQYPKHLLEAMYKNQAELWLSWIVSNSSINIFCAEKALIVLNPFTVATMWLNIGLFAANNIEKLCYSITYI